MNDQQFDEITRRLPSNVSRRSVLKGLLGLGAGVTTGAVVYGQTKAARRGFSGPKLEVSPTAEVGCPVGYLPRHGACYLRCAGPVGTHCGQECSSCTCGTSTDDPTILCHDYGYIGGPCTTDNDCPHGSVCDPRLQEGQQNHCTIACQLC